jgi:hypothetical protein
MRGLTAAWPDGIGAGGGEGARLRQLRRRSVAARHLLPQAALPVGTDSDRAQIIEHASTNRYLRSRCSNSRAARRAAAPGRAGARSGAGLRPCRDCGAFAFRVPCASGEGADRYDPAMARLIANLDYLGKGNLPALKRICRVDDEDLVDMIRELRAYDPKPGCRFLRVERLDAVVPDVFVAERKGGWAIELNGATLPKLLVNRSYYHELSSGPQDRKSKAWLTECLASANWLMKALDQRRARSSRSRPRS